MALPSFPICPGAQGDWTPYDEEAEIALRDMYERMPAPHSVIDVPWVPGLNCPAIDLGAGLSDATANTQLEWEAAALDAVRAVEGQAVCAAGHHGATTPVAPVAVSVHAQAPPLAAPMRKAYRRLQGKQPKPDALKGEAEAAMAHILQQALAAEDAQDPENLATTVKRQHVHYTWVRTNDPMHVQPSQYSRKQFYGHLEKLYAEVYPHITATTSSILGFGLVVDEQHKESPLDGHRDLHKHGAMFCTQQHYWNKVAKLSLSKYNIPLNAVAHETYATMYAYLRAPTAKKPLAEIDIEPYFSQRHPRGEALADLLRASSKSGALNRKRLAGMDAQKRKRLNLFEEIKANKLRSVDELEAHAATEAIAGRNALADFCSRQGDKVEAIISNAWKVIDAPLRLKVGSKTLFEKLVAASTELPCICGGVWAAGAEAVLARNGIPVPQFCGAVVRALKLGAVRGANVACVGDAGCGKSTLLQAFEQIFNCAPKPELGSTFPLASCAKYDILLWQDYEHDEGTVRFSDLLSFFMGEGVGVRHPGALNTKVLNKAPCFYTGRAALDLPMSKKHPGPVCAKYNQMMAERFTTFTFHFPMPLEERRMDFAHCGHCAALWYLQHAGAMTAAAAPAQPSAPPQSTIDDLERLARLHQMGALNGDEFSAAKRQCLKMF